MLEAALDGIQAINATVTSAVFVPSVANYPRQISSNQLPCILTWFGEQRLDAGVIVAEVMVETAVEAIAQGSFGKVKQTCLTLMDELIAVWQPYISDEDEIITAPVTRLVTARGFFITGILPSQTEQDALQYLLDEFHGFRLRFWVEINCEVC